MKAENFEEYVNYLSKEYVYECYYRISWNPKEYEKITKKQMAKTIFEFYQSFENILEICSQLELNTLEEIINNKPIQWHPKMNDLSQKLLIFWGEKRDTVPSDLIEPIKQALAQRKSSDFDKKERFTGVLVGLLRIHGELVCEVLIQMAAAVLDVTVNEVVDHINSSPLFFYYVGQGEKKIGSNRGTLVETFIYYDYLEMPDFPDTLDKQRSIYGIGSPNLLTAEEYLMVYYYGYNLHHPLIHNFYQAISKKNILLFNAINSAVELCVLHYYDVGTLTRYIENLNERFNEDLSDIVDMVDKVIAEMPSGALNGSTPNQKEEYEKRERQAKERKKQLYRPQTEAHLSSKEADLFYKLYFALLEFTNNQYQIEGTVKKIYMQKNIDPKSIYTIIEFLWENKEKIIDQFIEENPFHFNAKELSMIELFKYGFQRDFVIARFDRRYAAFICEEKAYMVKGVRCNLDKIISYQSLPTMVNAVLLPFNGHIIYDGIIRSMSMHFGPSFEQMIEEMDDLETIYELSETVMN